MSSYQTAQDTIIAPVNLANRHWAALFIRFRDQNRLRPLVRYFDPLGAPMPLALKNKLGDLYTKINFESDILSCPIRLQSDDYNCGPWVIAILENLIQNESLPPENFDIHEARARYRSVLRGNFFLKYSLNKS